MKSILIIGMGKFGHHLCADLIKNGNDIMVMDKDEAKVRDLIYDVTKVQNWILSLMELMNLQRMKNLQISLRQIPNKEMV